MDVFRRWQHELRMQVQPLIDELESMKSSKTSKKQRDEVTA